ncbi:mannose-6-phosphate isomerase, class I [Levilactobacillus parabrevis]|uniref:mannose-6-phosphate isomerase, class I n=1 Tax=Levilactobacillus parabrevis TaxID=357278 RepID=UPI0021A3CAA2|nr:mannose-6-phosphate isomerase, class I [Levilactobacillus parabrevis]MCT4486706.1 mannose-6-phosphate isomerase, class I [Levilactobacillus parabrevis]MCT4491544.1 mannose-6-phosphate isomerase, class I [Levilactobacillus parabrevis]
MQEPLFLKPIFHSKLWGGRKLEKDFGYTLPDGNIGECWAISGHLHGPNEVANGTYKGKLLSDLYVSEPQLFGQPQLKRFPLLIKILDAESALSVQVHPDDDYAEVHENDSGKTECWYVINAEPDAYLIYGHRAKSKEQLAQMIKAGAWNELLRKQPVKAGDFFYVPSGTVHALTKGIEVLETQQSSDVTYRMYDWDRVDKHTGKKRSLHIQQSLDVITVPFEMPKITSKVSHEGDSTITKLVSPPDSKYFSVFENEIKGTVDYHRGKNPFMLYSVIKGQGVLEIGGKQYTIVKGQHFIVPNGVLDWSISGDLLLISSTPSPGNY